MTLKEALDFVGGLSEPSKMPCYGYGTPAKNCKTGRKLRKIKNSVCSICYALKGHFVYPSVQKSLQKKEDSILKPEWEDAMVLAIGGREGSGYFRWAVSGDLLGLNHLIKIVNIANRLPHIKFWLPTREFNIVSKYVKEFGNFPDNLIVRFSAIMIDGAPPTKIAQKLGVGTSGVKKEGFSCPASNQNNFCLNCRACWQRDIENINYKKH